MDDRNMIISRLLSEYMIDLDYLYQEKDFMPLDQAVALKNYYLGLCPVTVKNDLDVMCDLALMSKMNGDSKNTAWASDFDATMNHQITLYAKDRFLRNLDAIRSRYEYMYLLN